MLNMFQRSLTFVILCAVWLIQPAYVFGAPFCIETEGLPHECWYYDLKSCNQRAEQRNAECIANPEDRFFKPRGAPFCLIDSSMVPACVFQSEENCDHAAEERRGVCLENTHNVVKGAKENTARPTEPKLYEQRTGAADREDSQQAVYGMEEKNSAFDPYRSGIGTYPEFEGQTIHQPVTAGRIEGVKR